MQQWVVNLFQHYPVLAYGIIIFVSFVEGPILAMFCGVLIHLGNIHFLPIYIALMIGDTIGDIFWYWLGYRFGHNLVRKYGHFLSISEQNVATVEKIFHKFKNRILIISKVTMGFGFSLVTLVTAGIVKIPFRQYLLLNVMGQFVWTGFLLYIGYMFGQLYMSVDNIFGKISVAGLFVTAFLALIGYGKYFKNRFIKASK